MTFNIWTFLFEVINFVVLAYVLYRLLYRPLQQAIDERRQAAEKVKAEAEQARREASVLEGQLHQQLAEVEAQRQQTMRQALEQAQAERQRLLAEAERTVQRRQEEMRQTLERERAEAWRSLRGEVVNAAIEQTRRLLREASDSTLDEQLALHLAETLMQVSPEQREQVQNHWQPGDGAVLESAHELGSTVVRRLSEAAEAVAGRPVELVVQRKPELLGGARLRLGGHVWDGSLAGQFDEKVEMEAEGREPCLRA